MENSRGFTLLELVVVVGLIGVLAAVTIPAMHGAVDRNKLITSSDLVAATVREARLAAITRNTPFRVRFDCPDPGAIRMLAVTGDAAIDNGADRCAQMQPNDGPAVYMPPDVTFGVETPPTLQIDGRGQISIVGGGGMPTTVSVSHGESARAFSITAAGRVISPQY